ncbi:hypothetical protein CFP66_26180 [Pseudonocardia sp. MH-G8]|nr:hypothetical protein CFP66_26180 [Pseudonocardia sp. MH-G8]
MSTGRAVLTVPSQYSIFAPVPARAARHRRHRGEQVGRHGVAGQLHDRAGGPRVGVDAGDRFVGRAPATPG